MSAITERRRRLGELLAERDVDLLLTEAMPDIRYFTGSMDSGGFLVVTRDGEALFITNAHDAPQAVAEAVDTRVIVWRPGEDPRQLLYPELAKLGTRVLVPSISGSLLLALQSQGITVEIAPGVTTHVRRVKEPAELDLIRQAARIVEAGMAAARDAIRPGVREIEIAAAAEYAMRGLGMDGRIFETKVESGPRSAMPSTYAGMRQIEAGDLILIDIGPTFRGYLGDLTRSFLVGDIVPERRALLELVLTAQTEAIATVRAGLPGHDVDEAARRVIRNAGFEDGVLHNTGHSLGLAGDSLPMVAPGVTYPMLAGECITVEPGAYRDGVGGVRIEDEILVTDEGCEVITSFPKTLDSLIVSI